MRAKDLPFPFSWSDRRPFFKEGIFYVPDYYQEHDRHLFPPLSTCFDSPAPIQIEYCSGNGEWIIEKAQTSPEINWIAVEKKFERVRKIYSKIVNKNLKNIIVISGEALTFCREYLPTQAIDRVFINFPDPWPKERHAKHRLIQKEFVEQLKRTVRTGGSVTVVTDHTEYLQQIRLEMQTWKLQSDQPLADYGSSYFERLWLSKGLEIHHLHYER